MSRGDAFSTVRWRSLRTRANASKGLAVAVVALLPAAAGYWVGYAQGSPSMAPQEVVIGLALLLVFILTFAKLGFALMLGPGQGPGPGRDEGPEPPHAPVPRPPDGRPPSLAAAAHLPRSSTL